tara:strand:- start:412 stop:633 length:222 start_codon:yes stop_codon:yes gene_type:complete
MRTQNGRGKNISSLIGADARNCGTTEGNIRTGEFNRVRSGAFNRVNTNLSLLGGLCPTDKGSYVKVSRPMRMI